MTPQADVQRAARPRPRRRVVLRLLAAVTLAAAAAACTPTKKASPRQGVLLVGDSFAANISEPLAWTLAAQGRAFESAAIPGCSIVRGTALGLDHQPIPNTQGCDPVAWNFHQERLDANRPSIVLWLGAQESWNRTVDGQTVTLGDANWDAVLLTLIEEKRVQLTRAGAKLVLVTMPPPIGPTAGLAPRFAHLNDLLREYYSANARTTGFIDLAHRACPSAGNPPCPAVVEGVTLRVGDGAHFSPAGAAWAARIIAELI